MRWSWQGKNQLVSPEKTKALIEAGYKHPAEALAWARAIRDKYGNKVEGRWFVFCWLDGMLKVNGMESYEILPCYSLSELAMEFPLGLEIGLSAYENKERRWMARTSGIDDGFVGETPVEAVADLLLFTLMDKRKKEAKA